MKTLEIVWRNSDLNARCNWSYFKIVHRLKIWMSPNHKKCKVTMSLFGINGLTVILCFTKFFVCIWIIKTMNTKNYLENSVRTRTYRMCIPDLYPSYLSLDILTFEHVSEASLDQCNLCHSRLSCIDRVDY